MFFINFSIFPRVWISKISFKRTTTPPLKKTSLKSPKRNPFQIVTSLCPPTRYFSLKRSKTLLWCQKTFSCQVPTKGKSPNSQIMSSLFRARCLWIPLNREPKFPSPYFGRRSARSWLRRFKGISGLRNWSRNSWLCS